MVKCPYCPKKFPTHHGLGGHLSGPCGIKLKASKAKASKPKPNAWLSAPSATLSKPKPKPKESPVRVNFGPKINAELRAEDRAKKQAAIPGKLASDMRNLAAAHRQKAEELEQMADRVSALA